MRMMIDKCLAVIRGNLLEVKMEPLVCTRIKTDNVLNVSMYHGQDLCLIESDWSGSDIREPWAGFYNWFENDMTDFYFIRHDDGEDMVLRNNIKGINIEIIHTEIEEELVDEL